MSIELNVNEASIAEVRADINQLRENLADIDEPLAKVSVLLDRWVQRNFRTQGGSVGGWRAFAAGGRLKPDGSVDASAKLLQDTGRLRLSFKPFHDANTAGIGSALRYSKVHEEGIGVPARRMLPKQADVGEQARRLLVGSLNEGL